MIKTFLLILVLSMTMGISAHCHAETHTTPESLVLADQSPVTDSSTTEMLDDISGPIELADPLPWKTIGAWTLFALIILVLIFFIVKNLRKQNVSTVTAGQKSLLALDNLAQIKGEKTSILYMEKISELLRIYIEERFQLQSTRQTTQEFLLSVSHPRTIEEIDTRLAQHKESLQDCLELSDMAKFAHCPPNGQSLDDIENAVRSFIQKTDIQENMEDTI